MNEDETRMQPPSDNLVRAQMGGMELRSEGTGMPIIEGHGAVFNQWTRIDSLYEGQFMERVMPGSFTKTLTENTPKILFDHGGDPQIGNKPLAPTEDAGEDDQGLFYRGRMFDTSYNRDLVPVLQSDPPVLGSSFRFSIVKGRETVPAKRDTNGRYPAYNPDGLPERTIREVKLMEMGPVVWPAYVGADAGVRSMTDEYVLAQLAKNPDRLAQLVTGIAPEDRSLADLADFLLADKAALQTAIDKLGNGEPLMAQEAELLEAAIEHLEPPEEDGMEMNSAPDSGAERAHSAEPATATPAAKPSTPTPKETTVADLLPDERASRMSELESAITGVTERFAGKLPADVQVTYDHDTAELEDLRSDERAYQTRKADLARLVGEGSIRTERAFEAPNQIRKPENIYGSAALADIETRGRSPEERNQLRRDFAMRGLEHETFPQNADTEKSKDRIEYLLNYVDEPSRDNPDRELARRIMVGGDPVYKRAWNKLLASGGNVTSLTPEEQRGTALGIQTTTTGGFLVPYAFDPTIIAVGAHTTINPYRRACKVIDIVGTNIWHGVTSTAVTAVRGVEALVAAEAGPTLAQPSFTPSRVQTQITYSIEVGQDRPNLGEEMGVLIQEAKDNEEEASFSIGTGATTMLNCVGMVAPYGTSGAYTAWETSGSLAFTLADLQNVESTIPVRFRMNAAWFMNRTTIRAAQALETAYGAAFNAAGNFNNPGYPAVGNPANDPFGNTGLKLLGYPVYESPSIVSAKTSHYTFGAFCDPKTYLIVDRVGMDVEFIPFIFGSGQGNMVTGQRALYAIWRNCAAPVTILGGLLLDYKT